MGIKDSDKVKNEKKSHIVIPVEREINEKELVNLVASFICSHEGLPIENAFVRQEGNNHIVQVREAVTNEKGKIIQVLTFTVQFSFMPKTCIVDFSAGVGKPETNKKDSHGSIGKVGLAMLIGAGAAVAPLVVAASGAAGVALVAIASKQQSKIIRQLKDNVFALICDYLGYEPDIQTEGTDAENVNTKENKTAETVTQTCECGYVFKQKMQFCPECGKKVVEPVEKRCECGNIISEGTKFCPQCGKSVDTVTKI